jgi:prepilin-type processing-associated H-X9-DG protein
MGASTYSHLTTPNSKTPDSINGCDTAATGQLKCVQIQPGSDQEGDTFAAARSQHLRGVNVVFADGSSKFITDDVDPKIWRALATRAGGDNDEMMSSGP